VSRVGCIAIGNQHCDKLRISNNRKSAMTLLSVIIPTFNRWPLLPRAVESVLNQTLLPDEVIIVDDGSTDATEAEFAARFPHLRYIRQKNLGVSAARNTGIREAHGDWLAFLDSDDKWLPEKLAQQIAALERNAHYQLCHTNEIWIRHGRRVNPLKKHTKSGGYVFRNCLPLCVISPSSVIIHRNLFLEVGLFDEELPACEDYDMWLRICARHPVLYLEELLLVKYGGHDDQLSRKFWGIDRFRITALEKIIRSGVPAPENRHQAVLMLLKKIGIFLEGAKKRGKTNDIARYEDKLATYREFLDRS